MTSRYSGYVGTKQTPQSEPIFGSSQVKNSAGGYVWAVTKWDQLLRFLILGAEGGTYYVGERKLVTENAKSVLDCIKEDPTKVVETVVSVSEGGRAPKQDPAIFVLALVCAHASPVGKQEAYKALNRVCRTGTHLFQFVQSIQDLRGWSRGLRNAVARWYVNNPNIEYQLAKYQSRNGWSHKDVMRLSHPKPKSNEQADLFKLVVGKGEANHNTPIFLAMEAAKGVESKMTSPEGQQRLVAEIVKNSRLSREMVPTQYLNKPQIQDALLYSMPITAMIRNLGGMTASGFLKSNLEPQVQYICDTIRNVDVLKKGRVHPIAILNALRTYTAGHGEKGKLSWSPVQSIVDALNDAFYLAFQAVVPTGKNFMLGCDISSSMDGSKVAGTSLTAREAAAAMALVTMATEKNCEILGFSNELVRLPISPKQRLDDVINTMRRVPFGGTDASLPIIAATQLNLKVDVFGIYTDNETWAGRIHPAQALKAYRAKTGINAKMYVVGTDANPFTIADPTDPGMLDVVGFDTSVPQIIAEFVK
jgi:60 kDa SS-A/Ro ribonucleoprotein